MTSLFICGTFWTPSRASKLIYMGLEATFLQQSLIQDGVIRQLEVIGEAVKQLSDELRTKHTHVPWQDISGMRDKLIHGYFGVDLEKVWLTAQNDLPTLKTDVTEILKSIRSKDDIAGNS